MKKLLLSLAVLLPCLMASAQSYTLSFVECEKTDGDGGTAYTKDVASIFGETDSVASIDKRDNINWTRCYIFIWKSNISFILKTIWH